MLFVEKMQSHREMLLEPNCYKEDLTNTIRAMSDDALDFVTTQLRNESGFRSALAYDLEWMPNVDVVDKYKVGTMSPWFEALVVTEMAKRADYFVAKAESLSKKSSQNANVDNDISYSELRAEVMGGESEYDRECLWLPGQYEKLMDNIDTVLRRCVVMVRSKVKFMNALPKKPTSKINLSQVRDEPSSCQLSPVRFKSQSPPTSPVYSPDEGHLKKRRKQEEEDAWCRSCTLVSLADDDEEDPGIDHEQSLERLTNLHSDKPTRRYMVSDRSDWAVWVVASIVDEIRRGGGTHRWPTLNSAVTSYDVGRNSKAHDFTVISCDIDVDSEWSISVAMRFQVERESSAATVPPPQTSVEEIVASMLLGIGGGFAKRWPVLRSILDLFDGEYANDRASFHQAQIHRIHEISETIKCQRSRYPGSPRSHVERMRIFHGALLCDEVVVSTSSFEMHDHDDTFTGTLTFRDDSLRYTSVCDVCDKPQV